MNCKMPRNLESADPRDRAFPPSWRDAAISALYDPSKGGVICPCCGGVFGGPELKILEADHIIPWSRGGTTTWDNLQLLCRSCNRAKYNHVKNENNE